MPYLEANESTFHYLESGDGPVALFVHGFPLDATMWSEQLEGLAALRRCLAIDLRGFGRSGRSPRPVLAMEDHAADLEAFLDKGSVAAAIDLVGLSMGGYVALAFAELYPERIRSIALIDTKSTPDSEEAKAGRDATAMRLVKEGRAGFATDMTDALLAAEASPWTRARVRTMIESTPTETMVAALEGMKQRPDRTTVLAALRAPVTVIVGEQDRMAPLAEAEYMARSGRGTLTVIPGAGHLSPIEQPNAVTAALRTQWLTG
ncbi:MAG: alpha/beta fold hydrolase [Acidimicrobiia bacterium]|nr:MAG: alpha/beta fold hydrolase [Acidimicrobiia bacterium]